MTNSKSILLNDPSQFRDISHWDIELRQIEPGDMNMRVSSWVGKDLAMIDLSIDKAVHQIGTSRKGCLAFGLPDPGSLKNWLGRSPEETPVMMFGTDQPFEGNSTQAFSGITFCIEADRVAEIASDCGMDVDDVLDRASKSSVSKIGKIHVRLRQIARCYLATRAEHHNLPEEEDFILDLLEMLSSVRHWVDYGNPNRRRCATRLAVDYMLANLEEDISIREVCTEIGASAPTLRRGFLETYGVGPKQFLLRARLNRVRAELSGTKSDRRITDIANKYGYWHMGQFAKDYRLFFGELPSETAR